MALGLTSCNTALTYTPDATVALFRQHRPLSMHSVNGTRKTRHYEIQAFVNIMEHLSQSNSVTLYEVLGVAPDVDLGEIKSAYRRLAKRCHPDAVINGSKPMHQNSAKSTASTALAIAADTNAINASRKALEVESTRLFLIVQHAYEVLSDPTQRFRYDQSLTHFPDLDEDASKRRWQAQLVALQQRRDSLFKDTWGSRIRSRNAIARDA